MPEMIIWLGTEMEKDGISGHMIQRVPEDITKEEANMYLEKGLANLIPKEDWNLEWLEDIDNEENEQEETL